MPRETAARSPGRVAAGSPLLALENLERHVPVEADLFKPRADYLLTVKGISMINAGILEGDLLAVHRTNEANDGDIIVARVDDDVTVKRLQRGRNRYQLSLLAENPDFAPIEVQPDQDFAIEGLYCGLVRPNR